ncbi:MAG: Glycerol-3-phosphate dehydrogenase [Cyanobacteriota bacterium erpe_2018_sw_21hr_WHONDRS-SW48-000092_B_bin.40]|jgi:glycerol-3-phosphate dehydrogenase (NAD(P)+)|nr:Glycerol-3-phosphate dehydrogenase [Cyanobacteriota bacterium erpe_2018_sw_21hr_WHONDRS-SW48-000092_B_bin.40]
MEKNVEKRSVTILGAGSWGLTLAHLWCHSGRPVKVYCRNQAGALKLTTTRLMEKPRAHHIPSEVVITSSLDEALSDTDLVVFACNSQSMRELATAVAASLLNSADGGKTDKSLPVLVSATKGLELGTQMRMSEILTAVVPGCGVASLSGPNLADEVLGGLPTASVVASADINLARSLQSQLSAPKFRVYASDDPVGIELGGTLKNVIAIAAGACDGLSLGVNAKASLLTRGLAEITRLAVRLGAKPQTMAGLAGMGDLFATCSGPLSRNYRVGFELARGKALSLILEELGSVAEGVPTAEAVCELSKRLGLELPIAEQVESTLKGNSTPAGAIMALLSRPLASE